MKNHDSPQNFHLKIFGTAVGEHGSPQNSPVTILLFSFFSFNFSFGHTKCKFMFQFVYND